MKKINKRHRDKCYCGLLSCETCRSQFQASFASAAFDLLGDGPGPVLLTLVPADGIVEHGNLTNFDLRTFVRRHHARLARRLPSDVTLVGAVDVSLNRKEDASKCWSFHIHAVLDRELTRPELKALKASCPIDRKKGIYKPINTKPIEQGQVQRSATYVYKSYFLMRSQYLAKPTSGRNPYLNSRDMPLKQCDQEELDAFFDQHNVADALILLGVKRIRSSCAMDIRFRLTR